jgi:hypothetical protein
MEGGTTMSALELVLSLVSDEQMDELIGHLSPETRQAIAEGEAEAHGEEIAAAVWHILEE